MSTTNTRAIEGPSPSLVVAVARGGVIGRGGQLPWRIPEDLSHFKRVTLGHTVIMGRLTFESIGRPLPGRTNIVLTRRPGDRPEGVATASSLEEALAMSEDPEPMVIGGGEVYRQALPLAGKIYLTVVDRDVVGDAYFPPVDMNDWEVVDAQEAATPGVTFATLTRKPCGSP